MSKETRNSPLADDKSAKSPAPVPPSHQAAPAGNPEDPVAELKKLKAQYEKAQKKARELYQNLENLGQNPTKDAVDVSEKGVQQLEKQSSTLGETAKEAGKSLIATLVIGATIAGGPVGFVAAIAVVGLAAAAAKGVKALWNSATRDKSEKPKADTPKSAENRSKAEEVKASMKPGAVTPVPAALKPVVKVGAWIDKARANQKDSFSINAVGAKQESMKLLSQQLQFKNAVKAVSNQLAVAVPVLAGQQRLSESLSLKHEQKLKSAINLAIAGGASTIQIPRDSHFTSAERQCMASHIADLNAAATKAKVPVAALAQANPTTSQSMQSAIAQAKQLQEAVPQAQQVSPHIAQLQQQQSQNAQAQQPATQAQAVDLSMLPESVKQALIEYDADDLGAEVTLEDNLDAANDDPQTRMTNSAV